VLLLPNLGSAAQIRNILSNLDIHIADTYPHATQYDPASLQYMLDFFRNVAQTIPATDSASASQDGGEGGSVHPLDPAAGRAADDSSKRAGIIVLREDLDFYAIPPQKDIGAAEMMEVKRAAARALLRQDGIFSGLKKSDEPGTTEAHLIEMLTAGYFTPPLSPFLFLSSSPSGGADSMLTMKIQRLQPRRQMGPQGRRAQQGRHLQPRARAAEVGHTGQRDGQQRGGHGPEAAAVLAQAGEAVLVGGRRARGRRGVGRRYEAEGLDPESVDAGDERHRAALILWPDGEWRSLDIQWCSKMVVWKFLLLIQDLSPGRFCHWSSAWKRCWAIQYWPASSGLSYVPLLVCWLSLASR